MAVTDYKVVEVEGIERLESTVKALIGDGWQPYGEAAQLPSGRYRQTLIKGAPGPADASEISVGEITTDGGTTIPAGTLAETLQAIADLADPQ